MRAVHGRRQQHRAGRQRFAGPARAVQGDERQVAASRVAGKHGIGRIATVGQQPAPGGMAVVGRSRERVFGRQPVVRDQRPGAEPAAQPRGKRGVGVGEAEGERTAVQVQQRAAGTALGHADPLRRHTVAAHRLPAHRRVQREMPRVHRLVATTQRGEVGVEWQRPARRETQQRDQRPAAPAAPSFDDADARFVAVHRPDLPCAATVRPRRGPAVALAHAAAARPCPCAHYHLSGPG